MEGEASGFDANALLSAMSICLFCGKGQNGQECVIGATRKTYGWDLAVGKGWARVSDGAFSVVGGA